MAVTPDANGYDGVELRLAQTPTCGMGDVGTYFPTPGNYLVTVEGTPTGCFPPTGPIPSVRFRVTKA